MSADNGIYILVTRGSGRRGREYRVGHAQAIDNLYYKPDTPQGSRDGINSKAALQIFGNSRVFTDSKIARGYAECKLDEHENNGIVEYGIVTLDCSHLHFPGSVLAPPQYSYGASPESPQEYARRQQCHFR